MSAEKSGSETSDDRGLFSPVILGVLVAAVVAIFALSVLLASLGSGEETPTGATVGSSSAIGHKGFYTLLERLGLPVARSGAPSATKGEPPAPGRGGLLILAEPDWRLVSFDRDRTLGDAPNVLIVLPKWWGRRDLFHDGWIRDVHPAGIAAARRLVRLIDGKAEIVRTKPPQRWTGNAIGAAPAITGDVQLIAGSTLTPLIGTPDGLLLGETTRGGRRIWVLADPDPIENHGIATPANTRFALALVDRLRGASGQIVFDETAHVKRAPERNWVQLLFKFPYVVVTGQLLVLLALLLLATMTRFGGAEVEPPPFAQGKMRLIDNIAALMDRAGHQGVVLRRYVSVKLAETGRTLHAPAGLDDAALAAWLDRLGASRGLKAEAAAILGRASTTAGRRSKMVPGLFAAARDMYRWTKDVTDGSGGRRDRR